MAIVPEVAPAALPLVGLVTQLLTGAYLALDFVAPVSLQGRDHQLRSIVLAVIVAHGVLLGIPAALGQLDWPGARTAAVLILAGVAGERLAVRLWWSAELRKFRAGGAPQLTEAD